MSEVIQAPYGLSNCGDKAEAVFLQVLSWGGVWNTHWVFTSSNAVATFYIRVVWGRLLRQFVVIGM